jgi:Flp pilus assembly protein CpaB
MLILTKFTAIRDNFEQCDTITVNYTIKTLELRYNYTRLHLAIRNEADGGDDDNEDLHYLQASLMISDATREAFVH